MESKEKFEVAKFLGRYRGFVRDRNDPEQLGRVRCQVPEVLGNDLLTDWAWPMGSWYGGTEDCGDFKVPPLGATIMVSFEAGDVNRPLYEAVWWGSPGGKNQVPKLARGVKDESAGSVKGSDQFASADGSQHAQPASPYAGKYPDVLVIKTKNEKHVLELDDTPGKGRVHVWHGPSQSWIEIGPDGVTSVRSAGRRYTLVGADEELHVLGGRHAKIAGADGLQVEGDQRIKIFGDRTTYVFGNDVEFVIGQKLTTTLQQWMRIAGIQVSDMAPMISHG